LSSAAGAGSISIFGACAISLMVALPLLDEA
jgi:hypothetical protein